MAHFDVNVIVVGKDSMSAAKIQQVADSIQIMVSIYAAQGPQVGTVKRFKITTAAAGALVTITSLSDAQALADQWGVKDAALDLFVVPTIVASANADGWSPVGGKCDKNRTKGLRSPVVSLNGSTANSGNTFAHEVGHFLGLPHCEDDAALCSDPVNFIKRQSNSNTSMTAAQSARMMTHCLITP
jgi:Metallo-peptidase family M12B Reprolysin-like